MTSARPVILVSASRNDSDLFWRSTYLGRSLNRIPEQLQPTTQIYFSNCGPSAQGLPQIYNQTLKLANDNDILVLVHDDVYLNDWHFVDRARAAVCEFNVVGVAGSINPDLSQPSWGLAFDNQLRETGWQPGLERSGAINHFDYACPSVSIYGPSPMPVALLDGVVLILDVGEVRSRNVRFDERFDFHMYDLDFSRSAVQAGLTVGTWPIAVTHNSGGGFDTAEFRESAKLYLDKWASATVVG